MKYQSFKLKNMLALLFHSPLKSILLHLDDAKTNYWVVRDIELLLENALLIPLSYHEKKA